MALRPSGVGVGAPWPLKETVGLSHPVVSPGLLGTGAHTSPPEVPLCSVQITHPAKAPGSALQPYRKGPEILSDLSPGECGGIQCEARLMQPDLKGSSV